MKKSFLSLILATGAMIIPSAQATTISDGQCAGLNCANPLSVFTGSLGTMLAHATANVSAPAGAPVPWTGIFRTAVFRNAGGLMDFYFQFSNNLASSDAIKRLTDSSFGSFTTDVGYRTDLPTELSSQGWILGTRQNPASADRTSLGTVVGFNFQDPNNAGAVVNPGETTAILVVKTNAVNYTLGNSGIIDGSTTNSPNYVPTTAPEPASMAMIGGGLIALATLRRRFAR